MVLSFELIDRHRILSYERGCRVQNETLSPFMYEMYVHEKMNCIRNDIKLIPHGYYQFLKGEDNVNKIRFSQTIWDRKMAPKLTDKINESLMPFQREAIYKMVKFERCINAADMGLGKSLQGLSALLCKRTENLGDLILCPGSLRTNWAAEIKKWVGDTMEVHVITKGGQKHQEESTKRMLFAKGIKIVSYDMAATFFKALTPAARNRPYFNTILCDESHYLKESTTKRYKFLNEVIKQARHVYLLSGTPAPNRNVELFTQFSLLKPMVFSNKRVYTDRYCDGKFDNFKRYDDRGASNMKELAFLTKKLLIRMRREDYLDQLPDVTRQRVILTPKSHPATFKKKMREFRKQLEIVEEDERAGQKLQQLASAMFRETAIIKEAPVVEYMASFCQSNTEKTVLFCIHHSMYDTMHENLTKFGEKFIGISGKTPMAERLPLIETFLKDPECKYALCTLGACSTGLNFTPAPQMIFLELSWNISDVLQGQCRINRIGGASKLSYTYLLCEDTLDEKVFKKINAKNQNTIAILEDGKDYGDLKFNVQDDHTFKRARDYEVDEIVTKKVKHI